MVRKTILAMMVCTTCIFGNKITDGIYWVGSASSSGTGLAITGKTNTPESIFFNPAGLNTNKKSSINASYTTLNQTNFSNVSYIASNQIISFGIGGHTNESAGIDKTTFNEDTNQIVTSGQYSYIYSSVFISAALKMPLVSFGHIGGSLHFHRMSIGEETLSGRSINLGFLITPMPSLSIGLTHHNVIPLYLTWLSKDQINKEVSSTIHKINTYRTFGIEYSGFKFNNITWKILADYDLDNTVKNSTNNYFPLKLGTELEYNAYKLKAGYNYRFLSFGLSIKLNQLRFNYSFMLPNEKEMLDNRHAIGLNYLL